MLVRPLEGHDVQIRSSALRFSPRCRVRWVRDLFDNSVALIDPAEMSDHLLVESEVVVEQFNNNPFDFVVEPHAREIPFQYDPDQRLSLAHLMRPCHPADEPSIREWLRPFLSQSGRASTSEFLIGLNKSVPLFFQYARREEAGVQTPGETLRLRSGSCRDFALLFMEAARLLGLASRFVTGYICECVEPTLSQATGATHAWTEIYIPGAGWKGFDPTGGVLAADLHVRAGVARTPSGAAPMSGSFVACGASFAAMLVDVRVVLTQSASFPKR